MCISRKYSEIVLYSDAFGCARVIDGLGLKYTEVHDDLERLKLPAYDFWNYGKFATYLLQTSPFVQIDVDAYLWKHIPSHILNADLIVQEIETRPSQQRFYQEILAAVVERIPHRPKALCKLPTQLDSIAAWNCGMFGGARLDLIHDYARECMRVMEDPANAPGWQQIADHEHGKVNIGNCGIAIEQLAIKSSAEKFGVIPTVFISNPSEGEEAMLKAGLTHLVGEAKSMAKFHLMLGQRLEKDFPELKQRIDALCPEY